MFILEFYFLANYFWGLSSYFTRVFIIIIAITIIIKLKVNLIITS